MIALSLALAYLGTLAFVAFQRHDARRREWADVLDSTLARLDSLEASQRADAALRDTVTALAIQSGMKPRVGL